MHWMPPESQYGWRSGTLWYLSPKYLGSQHRSESLRQSEHKPPFCDRVTISLKPGNLSSMPGKKQYRGLLRHSKHSRCPSAAETKRWLSRAKQVSVSPSLVSSGKGRKLQPRPPAFLSLGEPLTAWDSFHFLFCWHCKDKACKELHLQFNAPYRQSLLACSRFLKFVRLEHGKKLFHISLEI